MFISDKHCSTFMNNLVLLDTKCFFNVQEHNSYSYSHKLYDVALVNDRPHIPWNSKIFPSDVVAILACVSIL